MNGLMTVKEAAQMARVHVETIRRRIKDGSIKAVKFGNVYRVVTDSFVEYLQIEEPSEK